MINMKYIDQGIIIHKIPYMENDYILSIFSEKNGIIKGVCKYANTKKNKNNYEVGTLVDYIWSAKLENNLGTFQMEVIKNYPALAFNNLLAMLGIQSLCAVCYDILPERAENTKLYHGLITIFDNIHDDHIWLALFIRWEIQLLAELGQPLNTKECALSGKSDNIRYLSPKTGDGVSINLATPWIDKLLTVPYFISNNLDDKIRADCEYFQEVVYGLELTEFFLIKTLQEYNKNNLPNARKMLYSKLLKIKQECNTSLS